MRVHNLYEDENGISHWRDIEIEWVQETPGGKLSAPIPVSALIFRETPPSYDLDWHPAPRRQYIVNLVGSVQLTASDGEARVIDDDPALLEALMPRGYRARPEQVILIKVTAWNTNCRQHIPQKFDAADVKAALELRETRIAELEAEVAALKGTPLPAA